VTLIAAPLKAGPVPVPAAYAAAAKAKLKRDRESFAAFRAIDQQEHDKAHRQRVTSTVAAAEEDLRLWHADIEELEPDAAAALAAFRAAEDRAREAREYARQQLGAYELGKGKSSPAEETEALIRADTADQVASDAAKVMEGRQAELLEADRSLAKAAREGLAGAERQLDKARKAAEIPAGTAPISNVTIRANSAFMQADEIWNALGRDVRFRVQRAGEPRDLMSTQEWQAMMRETAEIGGHVA
jgi:hypothetical protein